MIVGLSILFGIFLLVGLTAYSLRRKRLPGVIRPWGVHYNPDCIYSAETISGVIGAFVESWTSKYPDDKERLLSALRDLDIHWHNTRVQYTDKSGKTSEVLALMQSPQVIHLWVGPKVNGERSIIRTGLLDQLTKLAQLSNNKRIDSGDPEVRKVLVSARERLF